MTVPEEIEEVTGRLYLKQFWKDSLQGLAFANIGNSAVASVVPFPVTVFDLTFGGYFSVIG